MYYRFQWDIPTYETQTVEKKTSKQSTLSLQNSRTDRPKTIRTQMSSNDSSRTGKFSYITPPLPHVVTSPLGPVPPYCVRRHRWVSSLSVRTGSSRIVPTIPLKVLTPTALALSTRSTPQGSDPCPVHTFLVGRLHLLWIWIPCTTKVPGKHPSCA